MMEEDSITGLVNLPPKDPRKKAKYNLLSRIFFCWVDPLFWKGLKRSLQHSDLYVHPSEADSKTVYTKFQRYWTKELAQQKVSGTDPCLWLVLLKLNWWRFLLQGFCAFVVVSTLVSQTFFLGNLTDYFSLESPGASDTRDAYLYAMGIALTSAMLVPLNSVFYHIARMMVLIMRVALLPAIYDKSLSLRIESMGKFGSGHVVNLASNDIHQLDEALSHFHAIWISPLLLAGMTYLMYKEISYSAFGATVLVLILIPFQVFLSRRYAAFKLKAAGKTDERVKHMNEIISGIRVVKMYGWEYAFHQLVASLRRKELMFHFKGSLIRAIHLASYTCLVPLMMFITFSLYVLLEGGVVTPRKVFVCLSLLVVVRLFSVHYTVDAMTRFSQGWVALTRIKKFLLYSRSNDVNSKFNKDVEISLVYKPIITGEDFPLNQMECTDKLSNGHDFTIGIVVDGLTMSWSRDHNKCVLQNVSFSVNQESSLLAVIGPVGTGKSTLLQCLLGELAPLSGSVKVTGSIAYVSQESWLFSSSLRENVLFGLPYKEDWYDTVINVCALDKDLQQLPQGDLTLVGERGVMLSGGQKARINLARAVYRQADVYLLDDPLSAVDAVVSRHIFDKCIRGVLANKCIVLVTHQLQYVEECTSVLALEEGCVSMYGAPKDISLSDSIQTNDDEIILENPQLITQHKDQAPEIYQVTCVEMTSSNTEEERNHGTISMKTYYQYFKAGGGYLFTLLVILVFLSAEGLVVVTDWWISDWADCVVYPNSTSLTCSLTNKARVGIYGGLSGTLVTMTIFRCILLFVLLLRASHTLHNRMFQAILRAPVLFFDTNPIGRILNRFSKDVDYLDDLLPFTLVEYVTLLSRSVAVVITAIIAIPYMLIAAILLLVMLLILRWYFLKTSRDIKRLEALGRSPVYSYFSTTLQGLPTIRAYFMEPLAMEQFYSHHNYHTQAWYLFIVTSRWFQARIDVLSVLFISSVAFSSVPLSSSVDAGLIGLALTYALSMGSIFQYCIKQSTILEGLMISVERVMALAQIPSEADLISPSHDTKPPPNWPTQGAIEMTDLVYCHSPDSQPVLKGISCHFKPSEKIGIVGRTGAGKSSLLSALFRLAEPQGRISIDGVDCLQLGLHELRKKISVIPQDPIVFSGTIRYNLDPFNCYDDNKLWTALEQVQLKCIVEDLDGQLDCVVAESGSNFSVGQRQLICLARALLVNNKILVLDEATANVDQETDSIIQQVIRKQFSQCTVLTIAHRLDTVMDYDKILVLQSGKLCEFGHPHDLLTVKDSIFLQLVEQTGPIASHK